MTKVSLENHHYYLSLQGGRSFIILVQTQQFQQDYMDVTELVVTLQLN